LARRPEGLPPPILGQHCSNCLSSLLTVLRGCGRCIYLLFIFFFPYA
jgi:hypothetical protein